jgi:hypothetical protein
MTQPDDLGILYAIFTSCRIILSGKAYVEGVNNKSGSAQRFLRVFVAEALVKEYF